MGSTLVVPAMRDSHNQNTAFQQLYFQCRHTVMDVDFGFYSKVAPEVLGAPTPAKESERLLDLAELHLTDHDDPALASLCTLLTNLFNVPLAGVHPYMLSNRAMCPSLVGPPRRCTSTVRGALGAVSYAGLQRPLLLCRKVDFA